MFILPAGDVCLSTNAWILDADISHECTNFGRKRMEDLRFTRMLATNARILNEKKDGMRILTEKDAEGDEYFDADLRRC